MSEVYCEKPLDGLESSLTKMARSFAQIRRGKLGLLSLSRAVNAPRGVPGYTERYPQCPTETSIGLMAEYHNARQDET